MPNLVGIGLSQVPTNSMLGGLAYQDPEHASIKDLDLKNLSQINSEIADTATAVFVYDTRKDSDGGAWRKRTQNTSWYNEPLGTSVRGTRKEFPAVAVIVGVLYGIKIYDGDDPDLPLWAYYKRLSWDSDVNSIAARDGKICFTIHTNNAYSGNGFGILDYVKDRQSRNYIGGYSNFKNGFVNDLIASKRETNTYLTLGTNTREFTLIDYNAKDVAMTVLPNAPIDSATGLPVPTIAVGTNGGISIINDDGTVVDMYPTGSSVLPVKEIHFTKSNKLAFRINNNWTYYYPIPSSDISSTYWNGLAGFIGRFTDNDRSWATNGIPINVGPNGITYILEDKAIGHTNGVDIIDINEGGLLGSGMHAGIANNFNTGYQHGDIKGAFLSDTDENDLIGGELIANGTFGSNTNGWTSQNSATITHTTPSAAGIDTPATDGRATPSSTGIIKIVSNGGGSGAYQSFTTVVGKRYTASFLAYQVNAGSNYVKIGTSIGGHQNFDFYDKWDQSVNNNWAQGVATFTATATTTYITLWPSQVSGRVVYMDQISVCLAAEDRSVNERGLQVFGTVGKDAVATGSDLVAYSNFSTSSHLRQPPNSNMHIGTGDAYLMIWYKTTVTSGTMMLISYEGGANGTSDYGKPFNIRFHNGNVTGWASHNAFATYDNFAHPVNTADGVWHCVAWVRRGAVFELYVDGEFAGSDTGAVGSNALSDANTELVIGARKRGKVPGDSEEPFTNGSLALARIGKTAPSPEQVKKMYDDEKCLFHENAKATLYGSSDAVTALAYDDTTNLLHVGTSAGRSEFQGLRRINNTTTAVTTAISASNGLVAEQ